MKRHNLVSNPDFDDIWKKIGQQNNLEKIRALFGLITHCYTSNKIITNETAQEKINIGD